MSSDAAIIAPAKDEHAHGVVSDFLELIKARLTGFVLFSAFAGYIAASRGEALNWVKAVATIVGIGLVASAAAALNQWMERAEDRLMPRTQDRPLAARRFRPWPAAVCGLLLALAGLACLWFFAGRLSMILALATILIYLALYTPLKQISVWCVPIGAISGALPPLIGAVSATGRLEAQGIFLFCVLALWQFPHFFAIAWMYRDDYAKGGFQVLPRNDESGRTTAVIALVGALLLLVICAEYAYLGHASMWFLLVVILPGTLLAGASLDFLLNRSRANARRLFLTSIAYLPVILIATVLL